MSGSESYRYLGEAKMVNVNEGTVGHSEAASMRPSGKAGCSRKMSVCRVQEGSKELVAHVSVKNLTSFSDVLLSRGNPL